MAVQNKLTAVYATLDLALANLAGTADQTDTMTKIVTKLKNRRGLLSELVNNSADTTVKTHAAGDVPKGDHLK